MLQQFHHTKARWKAATVATCVLLSTCVHGTTAAAAASLNPRPNILLLLVEDLGNGIWGFGHQHGYKYKYGLITFVELLHTNGYTTSLTYKTGVEGAPGADKASTFVQAWDFFDTGWTQTREIPSPKVDPFTNETADNKTSCRAVWETRLFEYFLNRTVAPDTPFYFLGQINDAHIDNKLNAWASSLICDSHMGVAPVDSAAIDSANFQGLGPYTVSTTNKQTLVGYYAAVQRVDYHVGRMLELLKESGHEQNTLTIFSSDHGISHVCKGKLTAYEGGLRVPLIMRWPGRLAAV
eukprot:gene16858-16770_t